MHSTAQRRVDLRGTSEPAGGPGGVRHPARGLAAGARVPAGDPGIAGPCRFSACVKGSKCARRGAIGTYGCAAALNQMGCRALSRMGRLDDYRRYAKECLDMANAVQDAKSRASLLQMAQVWLRLAQAHDAEKHSDQGCE
jgi:hypothetical protein